MQESISERNSDIFIFAFFLLFYVTAKYGRNYFMAKVGHEVGLLGCTHDSASSMRSDIYPAEVLHITCDMEQLTKLMLIIVDAEP